MPWVPGAVVAADTGTLLLPGVDIRDVDFTVGDWCRYLVIDEAMGETDTSEVYLAVVGRDKGRDAWWLEIESGPAGAAAEDRDAARFLVDGSVRNMTPGDSLYHYVSRLYIRRGQGPVETGDPRDLTRLTIVNPTSETDWVATPGVEIRTPAGKFTAELRQFENDVSREIPAGRVKIVQRNMDRVQVWRSPEAPVFHLVRCDIERVRETRTVPAVQGIPEAGPRQSRTTSVLIARGTGARPLLPSP
ncbi:MAG TPA: hypothetical protein VFX92_07370 [Candidatus Krumholzibacteria bacterium]|nr:hypothetical protein [Candidatus Krumholzibacteria bacterium]